MSDSRLRPGVRLGWYVPHVLPDLDDDAGSSSGGFGFCLQNRSGRLLTSSQPGPDATESTVDPGGRGACGAPPPDPAG